MAQLQELARQADALKAEGAYAEAARLWQQILTVVEKVLGPEHPDTATSLNNLAALYDSQGRYGDAEPLYMRSLAIREKVLGPEHPDTATSLNNLAALYQAQGRYGDLEPLFKRSLAIREKVLGPEHPDTANSLYNLARLYKSQGRYGEAEPLCKRSLAIYEKALGPEHPDTATSLNNLAGLYESQGRYGEAEPLYKRSLAIREKVLGPGHPDTATSLNNLAALYRAQGRYGEAEPLQKRDLAIFEKALGPEHPDTATSLNSLAELYRAQGRYGEAEPLYKRSLAIYEKALGPEHPDTATSLNNLARLYQAQGRYGEAENLYKRSLAIRQKVLGPEHPDTAAILNDLALLYTIQDLETLAEPLYTISIRILEKTVGPDHPNTGVAINSLAKLYQVQGRFREAELFYKRTLKIFTSSLGPDHPDTAQTLNDLAALYQAQGRYEEAETLFKRTLSIFEKALGPDHPDTATSLNNLAALYQAQGRHKEAEQWYKRSLAIREKALGPEHPMAANSLNNLAFFLQSQRRFNESEKLYRRALFISEKVRGKNHPETAKLLNNLAKVIQAQGQFADAESMLRRSLSLSQEVFHGESPANTFAGNNLALLLLAQGRFSDAQFILDSLTKSLTKWLRSELPLQPIELRPNLLLKYPDIFSSVYALLHDHPSAAPLALEARLNRQGLLADVEMFEGMIKRRGVDFRNLAQQVASLDRQLASPSTPTAMREQLMHKRQLLEKTPYQLFDLRPRFIDTSDVAAALRKVAPQGLLIEFQRYFPFVKNARGDSLWGEPRYLALLLRPNGSTSSVLLGDAAQIDAVVNDALAASSDPSRQGEALQRLAVASQLVLMPLQSKLDGVTELFLSPDGELNRLPFAALPVAEAGGSTLGESVRLRLLTTGRDLIRLQQPSEGANGTVLIAYPDYNAPLSTPGRRLSAPVTTTPVSPHSFGSPFAKAGAPGLPPWHPLPGTAAEAEQLAPLLRPNKRITGAQATVSAVLQQMSPRIFHIATHGFFQSDLTQQGKMSEQPWMQQPSKIQVIAEGYIFETSPMTVSSNALNLSGLVFSGANHSTDDSANDGYLTAAEVTTMNLEGTQLVTLSACETALGDLRNGEGVYGLQRSLAVAGARSTLLSLWKVDDALTALFMEEFYKRLKDGQGRADAFRNTQSWFRKNKSSTLRDVRVWGAFQLSGDWRSIRGW